MAASTTGVLKDYTQQNLNETLKSHNNVSFKLIKTGELITYLRFVTKRFYIEYENSYNFIYLRYYASNNSAMVMKIR